MSRTYMIDEDRPTATIEEVIAAGRVVLDPAEVKASPFQIRRDFGSVPMLSDKIAAHGLLHSPTIRFVDGEPELICGECRTRAVVVLNNDPARYYGAVEFKIKQVDDKTALEIAMSENLDRKSVNPIEEAIGYAKFVELGETHDEVAARFGLQASTIGNRIRLLRLPTAETQPIDPNIPVRYHDIQALIAHGELSTAHGVALCSIVDDPAAVRLYARKAIEGPWSQKVLEQEIAAFRAEREKELNPPLFDDNGDAVVTTEELLEQAAAEASIGDDDPDATEPLETDLDDDDTPAEETEATPGLTLVAGGSTVPPETQGTDEIASTTPETATTEQAAPEETPAAPAPPEPTPLAEKDEVEWEPKPGITARGKVTSIEKANLWVKKDGEKQASPIKLSDAHKILTRTNGVPILPLGTKPGKKDKAETKPAATPAPPAAAKPAAPAPAAPKAPEGTTMVYVPTDDLFWCEDRGVTAKEGYPLLKRLITLAEDRSITPDEYLTALENE